MRANVSAAEPFTVVPQAAIDLVPVIGASAFTVYVAYRRHRNNKTGLSRPSVPTVARELGVNEKTVKGALATLITCGLLVRHSRPGHSSEFSFPTPPPTQAEKRPGSQNGPGRKAADDPGRKTADTRAEKRPTELDEGTRLEELHTHQVSASASADQERTLTAPPVATVERPLLELREIHAPGMIAPEFLDLERRAQYARALAHYPAEDTWVRFFAEVQRSPFLRCGEGGRWAGADLDWATERPRRIASVIEGKYSRDRRRQRSAPLPRRAAVLDLPPADRPERPVNLGAMFAAARAARASGQSDPTDAELLAAGGLG